MRPTDGAAGVASMPMPRSEPSTPTSKEEPSIIGALLMVGFGMFCLFGAYQSLTGGHWPAYMPPQLDLFAVPLSWLSEKLGAYVGGILAGLVGLGLVLGGLMPAKRRDAA